MKDLTKYDELAFNATTSLVNDSVWLRSGTDGFCHELLTIVATLICDSKHSFQDLLKSALNVSPKMSDILNTVAHECYSMVDTSDMSVPDMERLLNEKDMSYKVFKMYFSGENRTEQLSMIRDLLGYIC